MFGFKFKVQTYRSAAAGTNPFLLMIWLNSVNSPFLTVLFPKNVNLFIVRKQVRRHFARYGNLVDVGERVRNCNSSGNRKFLDAHFRGYMAVNESRRDLN